MVSSVMLDISSNTFWATVSSEAWGMKPSMKVMATVPSAKAMGMPLNRTMRVAAP